jgi:hypothetical protein
MHKALTTAVLMLVVAYALVGTADAKKRHFLPRPTCDQLHEEVAKTGPQLEAQYNAMGFTIGLPDPAFPGEEPIDGFLPKNACQTVGKRSRQGGGLMNDIHSAGEPPFPGETNPAIREYSWDWSESLTRTKKGKLRDAVTSIRCQKFSYYGPSSDPGNIQSFPC